MNALGMLAWPMASQGLLVLGIEWRGFGVHIFVFSCICGR